eukprot:gene2668-1666_t
MDCCFTCERGLMVCCGVLKTRVLNGMVCVIYVLCLAVSVMKLIMFCVVYDKPLWISCDLGWLWVPLWLPILVTLIWAAILFMEYCNVTSVLRLLFVAGAFQCCVFCGVIYLYFVSVFMVCVITMVRLVVLLYALNLTLLLMVFELASVTCCALCCGFKVAWAVLGFDIIVFDFIVLWICVAEAPLSCALQVGVDRHLFLVIVLWVSSFLWLRGYVYACFGLLEYVCFWLSVISDYELKAYYGCIQDFFIIQILCVLLHYVNSYLSCFLHAMNIVECVYLHEVLVLVNYEFIAEVGFCIVVLVVSCGLEFRVLYVDS